MFKPKPKPVTSYSVKGTGLAVPVRSSNLSYAVQVRNTCSAVLESYQPFVKMGCVSLVGSDIKVPVKILRDIGAFDSFILAEVLPFSRESKLGSSVPVRGMGLNVLHVPLHKVMRDCDLFQGEAALAVRSALPIEGIAVILGNKLAGDWVLSNVSPSVVVEEKCLLNQDLDESKRDFPEVFTACAVTRAMSRIKTNMDPATQSGMDKPLEKFSLPLSDFPLSVSHSELVLEQQADSSLSELFQLVKPDTKMEDIAIGYFLQNSLLVRKWVDHKGKALGNPVFQIVVPSKFLDAVLKVAHNESGHSGVHKTYDRVLRHFFWPRVKRDVSAYIKTCHACQLTGKPNQTLKPAPLFPIPAVSQPFEHLIVDCVGPLPRSKSGANYLLTVMCQSTRYPAAYPLRTITTRSVVRALSQFFNFWHSKGCSIRSRV